MRSFRPAAAPFLALAMVTALAACESNSTSGGGAGATPAPQTKALPGGQLPARVSASSAAGTFDGVALDPATRRWLLLSGTDIARNTKPIDLRAVGSAVTLEAVFQPAGGTVSLHGYGFKLLTGPPASAAAKNGYTVFFEEPGRLDIYREADGKYKDINDTRPPVPMFDGAKHTLRVVLTHSAPARMDVVTFVDGRQSSTGHDASDLYTAGSWGPTNNSNTSVAFVSLKPAVVSGTSPH